MVYVRPVLIDIISVLNLFVPQFLPFVEHMMKIQDSVQAAI
jgi:hypothetical protein